MLINLVFNGEYFQSLKIQKVFSGESIFRFNSENFFEESIRKRIVTYNDHTLSIIDHYAGKQLVKKVDGARPPDEVRVS